MFMNSRMFGFKEMEEVKETRPANKTFYNKVNETKAKMTDEEWEKLLKDLDKPLSK